MRKIGNKIYTHIELPAETTQKEVINTVISLNNDDSVHGILIQSPLLRIWMRVRLPI